MFSFSLSTKYIFSMVDFVNVSLFSILKDTPGDLLHLFDGRSTSNSNRTELRANFSIFVYIRTLWESMKAYFPFSFLVKNGLDFRDFDNYLYSGVTELIHIVNILKDAIGGNIIKVHFAEDVQVITNLQNPSVKAIDCHVDISFTPDIDNQSTQPTKSMYFLITTNHF